VKIRGGVDEISVPIIKALPTTELPEYIQWPSTERGGLIKKERKESSLVNLKVTGRAT